MVGLRGHSDMKMTDRYTRVDVSYQRSAVRQLPGFGRKILEAESPRISPHSNEVKVVGFGK